MVLGSMRASNGSKVSRTPAGFGASSAPGGGAERYVLGMALLLPLAVVILALAQLPSTSLASPPSFLPTEANLGILGKRPASSNPAPPPTLVPPTATPRPTATPVPPTPVATLQTEATYTVKPGDQL